MPRKDGGCDLTAKEVSALFSDPAWAATFPPILSVDQAATLAQVPKQTVYAWSSRGLLKGCSRRAGKHLRILRDKYLLKLFNEGLDGD
ncbi:MAG: DNA-binding protein [Gemmataceae bacterium]|nr:DNA-binding protein [Gemmataceae bacterium]